MTQPNERQQGRSPLLTVVLICWLLTAVGVVIDLLDGEPMKLASSLLLFIGLGASVQWLRFRSRRWRTIAWLCFALAFAALLYRFGGYGG